VLQYHSSGAIILYVRIILYAYSMLCSVLILWYSVIHSTS
jgi:hypothetical protein